VLENVRPNATLTYSATHVYGDDGSFTVTVCGFDDDTSTCKSTNVTITNVDPTVAIDESGATLVNGVPTIFGNAGAPVPFSGNATDPGSDDLTFTWDWDDGTTDVFVSLVNPPATDPDPSPTLQPRNVTDSRSHTFGDACLYDVELTVTDDDGGSGDDAVKVIIVGNATLVRSAGYWQQQYRGRPGAFPDAQLLCFLDLAGHMSTVFHEVVDASTIAKARQVLSVAGNGGDMKQIFDRQLLAAWLNFANGAVALTELVDTDGNGTADTTFWAAVQAAEAVRLDPTATRSQLEAQKNILEQINLIDE
jgi:PKD domain